MQELAFPPGCHLARIVETYPSYRRLLSDRQAAPFGQEQLAREAGLRRHKFFHAENGICPPTARPHLASQGRTRSLIQPARRRPQSHHVVRPIGFSQTRCDDVFDDELDETHKLKPLNYHHKVDSGDVLKSSIPHIAARLPHPARNVILGELFAGASEDSRRFVKFHQLTQPEQSGPI